jgi:hypothetical protein
MDNFIALGAYLPYLLGILVFIFYGVGGIFVLALLDDYWFGRYNRFIIAVNNPQAANVQLIAWPLLVIYTLFMVAFDLTPNKKRRSRYLGD